MQDLKFNRAGRGASGGKAVEHSPASAIGIEQTKLIELYPVFTASGA